MRNGALLFLVLSLVLVFAIAARDLVRASDRSRTWALRKLDMASGGLMLLVVVVVLVVVLWPGPAPVLP